MFKKGMKLEGKLFDQIPLNPHAVDHPDAFGVEVELEGMHVVTKKQEVAFYWTTHQDNSLRAHDGEAIEYVFHHPLNIQDTTKAIDALFNHLLSPGVSVFESYRTSIHVHVNFGMETYRTIYNFITLCLILDELLTSQNGEHRIGNNFCLRAKDAQGQVAGLIHSVETGQEFYGLHGHERYSSINFVSLLKFGSIEFRSLECTTHKGRLMHWIGTLGRMKEAAKKFDNPQDVIGQFSKMGWRQFLALVLGPYSAKYITVHQAETMLHHGMRLAQDFAFCSEWKARDVGDISPAEKKKAAAKLQILQAQQAYQPLGQAMQPPPQPGHEWWQAPGAPGPQ